MSKTAPLLTLLLIVAIGISGLLGRSTLPPQIGALVGLAIGVAWVVLARFVEKEKGNQTWNGVVGAIIGLFLGGLSTLMIEAIGGGGGIWSGFALVAFPYTGLVVAEQLRGTQSASTSGESSVKMESGNILDTSAIIDGRIVDVAQAGFLPGLYIIPQFILKELQYIADSSDSLRRVRGRRGLDMIQRLQKVPNINVRIIDADFPSIHEVDSKLVALGKKMSAKIITNDFNLNKIAGLQGVKVLNINQLAGALRSVLLPGESTSIFISREGKEPSQGVGYMEDGTMIVVEDGRRAIGKTADVVVSSVLQTPAGRMIFARLREPAPAHDSVETAPTIAKSA